MIAGREFHGIIKNIFDDVRGLYESEQLQVCCPKCAEREGLLGTDGKYNLEINTSKRQFKCWKCDAPSYSGSLGRLIRRYGSEQDFQQYKMYAGIFTENSKNSNQYYDDDEQINVSLPKEMILFSDMDSLNPKHIEAYSYLILKRNLNREIILKYNIGFCLEGRFKDRIIIPSYDKFGDVNYFVARSFDKKSKSNYLNPDVNKSRIIFNEYNIEWYDSTVYIVEGVFEMLTIPVNTVPILGKNLSAKLIYKLKECRPNLVVVLDPDAYAKSIELFQSLKSIYVNDEHKVKIVKLENKINPNYDLDEIRTHIGLDEVIRNLYNARELIVEDYFENKLNGFNVKRTGSTGTYLANFEGKY